MILMAMTTYPLNNILYQAEDAELFHCTRTSGVYDNLDFQYSVTGADNNVTIGKGLAWIKNAEFAGKVSANKEPIVLDLGLTSRVLPRIDAIVIQFDANKNATSIIVKKGEEASEPQPPKVLRTENTYELHLYHILRKPSDATITESAITDLRNNYDFCGIMRDSVTRNIDYIYPVGSIYMSVNAVNPEKLFGGKWEQLKDKFLLGSGDTYSAGTTGGEAEHVLTKGEMPKHSHDFKASGFAESTYSSLVNSSSKYPNNPGVSTSIGYTSGGYVNIDFTGEDKPHNNMPPYLAVYMWKRVS